MITDVELTPGQQAFREEVEAWTRENCSPQHVAECDEKGEPPLDLYPGLAAKGWLGIGLPADWGGFGGAVEIAILMEELSRIRAHALMLSLHSDIVMPYLVSFGSEEQKVRWLPPLLESPILCAFGLSEPGAGSDVASLQTSAVREGDEYVLNGSKTFITNAGYASWTVVFAKTDPKGGHRGMSAFVVPVDAAGGMIEKHLDKMGQRSTDTAAFALQDVRVPVENRIGEEGDGFRIAQERLGPGRAAGAGAVIESELGVRLHPRSPQRARRG